MLYNVLVPDIEILLSFNYAEGWLFCEDRFLILRGETVGYWPSDVILEGWLKDGAKEAIMKCARTTGGPSKWVHLRHKWNNLVGRYNNVNDSTTAKAAKSKQLV